MPAGIEVTPSDPLTGLPCPVLMKSTDFYFSSREDFYLKRRADYHHLLHPGRSAELGFDENKEKLPREDPLRIEGLAVRYCMGEYMPRWLHDFYHDIFYGPKLPQDTHEKFVIAVLACAGVVPRIGINLYTPGEWHREPLNNKQHDFIRRRIFYEGADSFSNKRSKANDIGKFFAHYIINQTLPEVANETAVNRKIHQFLEPTTREQGEEAGSFIIDFAAKASVLDVVKLYNDAKSEGMVAEKQRARKLGDVVLKFFKRERFPEYFNTLETQARLVVT